MALVIEELRPDGTVSNTGSVVNGASAHAVLADDSDTSYVELTVGEHTRVTLDGFTLPAGARTLRFTVEATDASVSGNPNVVISVYSTSGAQLFSINGPYTSIFNVAHGQPFTLTQQLIDDLQVNVSFFSGSAFVDMDEVIVTVEYYDQPEVTVTDPTGTITTTSFPLVEWTLADVSAPGGASRHHVKVFDDATIAGGGFDPDTSTPTYDSGSYAAAGETTGAQHTPTTPIPNGDTYRAYVRTAQTVNGALHWSEWDQGPEFTMDLVQPDPPTMVVTEQPSTASVLVELDRPGGDTIDWERVEIQQYNPTSGEERFVRGQTHVPADAVDEHAATDFEPPTQTTGWVYRARVFYTLSSQEIASEWSTSAEVLVDLTADWLKDPADPTLNITVNFEIVGPTRRRPITQGVFSVVGRTDPIVVTDVRRSNTGELNLYTLTDEQRLDLEAILDSGRILYLDTQPAGGFGAAYIAVGDLEEIRAGRAAEQSRRWLAPYTAVSRPVDDESEALQ